MPLAPGEQIVQLVSHGGTLYALTNQGNIYSWYLVGQEISGWQREITPANVVANPSRPFSKV